jgi:hypothetical protein
MFSVFFKTYNSQQESYFGGMGKINILSPEIYVGSFDNDEMIADVPEFTELLCEVVPNIGSYVFTQWADSDTNATKLFTVTGSNPFVIEASFGYD